MPLHPTMRTKQGKPPTTAPKNAAVRRGRRTRHKPPERNPLWSFRSDAWRAYAFTIGPVCGLIAVIVIAPHAQAVSVAALATLVSRLLRP